MKVIIDGIECEAEKGELVIKVAERNGVYIPRFCWHERMKPVGMCRMCLVEIEGQRGLPPACTATVADGMVVKTDTPVVKKAQEGCLEFLLINHPLDCPVCDRGGECPLQDLTFGYGPGESRFVEEKRHFAKPLPISDLVLLDRERCILCARCTRFADEIAGDPLINFVDRGGNTQVLTFPDDPFVSYFSGNTVQLCPVGALLAAPYRFRARPWDLSSVETSCQGCSMHCRIALQSSANRLVRVLGVDSEPVNHGWVCDKGRFGFEYVHHESRITEPQIKGTEATWPEALDAAAEGLRSALAKSGPRSVAVIGGARGTNEDAYVWARFAKGVLRTDNVDCQLGDGLPAEVVNGLPRALIADCDTARAIVLVAPDLKEELAVGYLRVKRAALDLKVPLIELSASSSGLTRYATVHLSHRPGAVDELAARLLAAVRSGTKTGDPDMDAAAELIRPAGDDDQRPVVLVLGRASLAEQAGATMRAAAALGGLPGVRVLSALRRGNVHGGLDLGLAPGMLPGRTTLEAGRAWYTQAWGGVPEQRGLDAEGILRAAADGGIEALILLGADPLSDFPDPGLARAALARVPFILAVDAFLTPSSEQAGVFLPAVLFGEKRGTATNLEGRVQRLTRKVAPPGTSMEDWRVAAELALRFDVDLDLEGVDEVTDEISRLSPAHRGASAALLRSAVDGAVIPLGQNEALVLGGEQHAISPAADADAGPIGGPVESLAQSEGRGPAYGVDPGGVHPAGGLLVTATGGGAPTPDGPWPEQYRWDRLVPAVAPASGDSLRLVASRQLYDTGVAVSKSPAVAHLAKPAVATVHPAAAERLSLSPGELVNVSSGKGTVTVPLAVDRRMSPGAVSLAFSAPDHPVATLIDAGAPVTDVVVSK